MSIKTIPLVELFLPDSLHSAHFSHIALGNSLDGTTFPLSFVHTIPLLNDPSSQLAFYVIWLKPHHLWEALPDPVSHGQDPSSQPHP